MEPLFIVTVIAKVAGSRVRSSLNNILCMLEKYKGFEKYVAAAGTLICHLLQILIMVNDVHKIMMRKGL